MASNAPNSTIYVSNLYEKLKKEELKKCLYAIFSQFGKILDVICMKTYRLRGQAWIVFSDVTSATNALTSMQGFPFFDKPMRLQYAHGESDATARAHGRAPDKEERPQKRASAREQHLAKGKAPAAAPNDAAATSVKAPSGIEPPNKILFVQNLPPATNSQMLGMLFQQFPGFKEVRMVDARPGISFVEFENDMQASVAMTGLQAFKITPTNAMNITYAKQ
jgi:U2 small nuclear ribonucleoprotein B''